MDWKRLIEFALLGRSGLEQYAIVLVRVSLGLFFAISGANKLCLLSNICGLTLARGGDQACDRARVPWPHRCESRKNVWLSLGFCC